MKKMFSLKDKRLIQAIISLSIKKNTQTKTKHFIIHSQKNEIAHHRFCLAVSKKRRNAPERNLVKRQLRAMIALERTDGTHYDFVIIPKVIYNQSNFQKLKDEINSAISKIANGGNKNGKSTNH